MSTGVFQKQKILYLKEFFEVETDEEHGVTMEEILLFLESKGINAERKAIYDDISNLRKFGLDIGTRKSNTTQYMLRSSSFQLAELKLLVDAVGASRFITRRKSLELIKKIERLTSRHHARELDRQVFVDRRIKNMNESIYYSVDVIHQAIADNKQLRFRYFDYSRDNTRVLRQDGDHYFVSPLALLYKDENYYLAAWSDTHQAIVNYRVDRMLDVDICDDEQVKNRIIEEFDPASYVNSQFSMFSGDRESVEIVFHNKLSTVVIDRFGSDIIMHPYDETHFSITINVDVSPTFFSWIFMFKEGARIISPLHVVTDFINMTGAVAGIYSV